MKRNNSLLGGGLILIGALLLAARYLFNSSFLSLGPNDFWPMIILLAGVGFELAYFITLRAPGLLVPGGMLITYGFLFFFEVMTDWRFAAYTWPVYLVGIAIGLFQLYVHSGRPKGLLIAVGIISGIATAAFLIILFAIFLKAFDLGVFLPIILVLGGLVIVFGSKGSTKPRAW